MTWCTDATVTSPLTQKSFNSRNFLSLDCGTAGRQAEGQQQLVIHNDGMYMTFATHVFNNDVSCTL
jgi:hypothetical protein